MTITHDFDPKCMECLDTGQYFDGVRMKNCRCEEGKKLDESRDKGKAPKKPKPSRE